VLVMVTGPLSRRALPFVQLSWTNG
jgi:hypothetical protein